MISSSQNVTNGCDYCRGLFAVIVAKARHAWPWCGKVPQQSLSGVCSSAHREAPDLRSGRAVMLLVGKCALVCPGGDPERQSLPTDAPQPINILSQVYVFLLRQ